MNKKKANRQVNVIGGWSKGSHKHTVRYFKEKKNPIEQVEKHIKSAVKYKCKIGKADHVWLLEEEKTFFFLNGGSYYIYRCKVCHKKDWSSKKRGL